jgi:hypothetical protein
LAPNKTGRAQTHYVEIFAKLLLLRTESPKRIFSVYPKVPVSDSRVKPLVNGNERRCSHSAMNVATQNFICSADAAPSGIYAFDFVEEL